MTYDLIIVSQSTERLIPYTQKCIDTARQDGADLYIIVVETGQPYKYDVDKLVEYSGGFNYNHALNVGLKYRKSDIHILANNDLIFHPGWSQIGELMRQYDYHSASALEGRQRNFGKDCIYEGYAVGNGLNGWCLFIDDYCLDKIGALDESVKFWFSDNLYALQIQKAGIRHALFTNIRIDHIESKTLNQQPSRLRRNYQLGEKYKFNERSLHYA